MVIQWYPGHMTKAKRMLAENLKLIDVIIEIVDARAPISTRNPDFEELFEGKSRVVLLNKSDLADKSTTSAWISYFKNKGISACEFVATNGAKKKAAIALIENAAKEKVDKMLEKGVRKTVRAMIVGIPNVGKSTLINTIAGVARAQVGDRPGVTQGKQWVKINPYLELMDTPGLLWPKFEDETVAKRIAFIGSVKDDILDFETIAAMLLVELMKKAPQKTVERYKKLTSDDDITTVLDRVCESRGFILSGRVYDTERAARVVLDEFRAGKIAKISFESPHDILENTADDDCEQSQQEENSADEN